MDHTMLEIKVALGILKPVNSVFEAIVDPQKMSVYFISESSGRMVEGQQIIWRFPEFDEDAPINVIKIKQDQLISFIWKSDQQDMVVEIQLTPINENHTLVTITEKQSPNNEAGIKWLKQNTEGWANFLCCLKAYLEYGINLRKGGFDHMMAL